MEKLINNKKILVVFGFSILLLVSITSYFITISKTNNEKYFDIILANLYNDDVENFDNNTLFLSGLEDPKVSFFSDLKLASIENLDKYKKLDRDIILLKKLIVDQNLQNLKNLSKDENFIFKDIAQIFVLNLDLNSFQEIYNDNGDEIENFFLKAVSRYAYENN